MLFSPSLITIELLLSIEVRSMIVVRNFEGILGAFGIFYTKSSLGSYRGEIDLFFFNGEN